ncbi:hypothetical protein BDA96_05G168000 [Sorghum bicolor]|uniref:Knottin scorpion toxin-like domain-containing protein n=1 Tax=Sorghum bicolor TaxID=4558 RepID=A0A921UFQ0_SORBI|nr:uncharacterized protein LOC110435293 isoform X2 [Sorghum bicolor]KAG0530232.1 hypothetical protein BDA96_05G168000 [Sorghum bicolor]|eukprot:XP_021316401.1 uncharacterized protein LOC110435293 isoform X2 [Sorghum bicolor]
MSFSKQNTVSTAIALALLLLTSHPAGAEEDKETIVPLKTCEVMIKVPCWGKNSICIPICIAKGYTGGFCDVATCMCTKQCPDEAAAAAEAAGPSSSLPPVDVQPPLGKRGIQMLN